MEHKVGMSKVVQNDTKTLIELAREKVIIKANQLPPREDNSQNDMKAKSNNSC